MGKARRRVLVVIVIITASSFPMTAHSATPCVEMPHVPVALSTSEPADEHVYAEMCVPRHARTVFVLTAGSTYGHTYWDFPYEPDRYSTVRALNEAGYATLNYDRIGVGRSSYPPSPRVTLDADAHVLHQLVSLVRRRGFANVVVGGHSHGSIVSLFEAAHYRGVDAVVLTGLAHNVNLVNVTIGAYAQMRPAMLEPRFADRPIDPGYTTFAPVVRRRWIHDPANTAPKVLALDESLKETDTPADEATEAEFGRDFLNPVIGSRVNVPVLLALGGHDLFMCGPAQGATDCTDARTVAAAEQPYFSPAARLATFVLPGAGHSFALERNAPDFHTALLTWAARSVGT